MHHYRINLVHLNCILQLFNLKNYIYDLNACFHPRYTGCLGGCDDNLKELIDARGKNITMLYARSGVVLRPDHWD